MIVASMRSFSAVLQAALFAALLAGWAGPASAHKSSDAYLQLQPAGKGIELRVDIALRDLDVVVDIDADVDGRLTWGEVKASREAIERYVMPRIGLEGCPLHVAARALERRSDGAYAVLKLASGCALPAAPQLRYTLFAEVDPTHRGILRVQRADRSVAVRLLDPTGAPTAGEASQRTLPSSFFAEGVHHIVTGYDHLLFLLCLILPAVMHRAGELRPGPAAARVAAHERAARDAKSRPATAAKANRATTSATTAATTAATTSAGPRWLPVAHLGDALLPVLWIVTAFTLAHSMTLALAALKIVSLPTSFVEPAIAATIVLAALDNLVPLFGRIRRWMVAFGFGLIHGFGFAGVLGELDLPPLEFAWALLRFNLGLEFGQIVVVALAIALLFALRRHRAYPRLAIGAGSMVAIVIGALWFVERTAQVSLLPI